MDNFINRRICGNGFVPGLVGINSFLEPVLDESGSLDEPLDVPRTPIAKCLLSVTKQCIALFFTRCDTDRNKHCSTEIFLIFLETASEKLSVCGRTPFKISIRRRL